MRKLIALSVALLLGTALAARAEIPDNTVKIGVLNDGSGPFADQTGHGSVVAAELAVEDFEKESPGLKVQILYGDHHNKPDVGSAIARRWLDEEGVAAIADLPNSAVALAVNTVTHEKNRTLLASSTATSDLTGKFCEPQTVQWILDTWALGHAMGHAITQAGGKRWFFIGFEYALGTALVRDTTEEVKALGGSVAGEVKHPLGTTDFSAYLLQAQSSGADVVAFADTGTDLINGIKQAAEFGVSPKQRIAALFLQLSDVDSLGLKTAQGLLLSEAFYWDMNDRTRAWSQRFAQRMGGRMPVANHAGVYSAIMAYLHAVKAANAIEGDKVVAEMRRQPIDDPLFGQVRVRADGRAVHNMYVFRVKKPDESKGRWDYYQELATIPADQAFRPLQDGGCKLVH